MKSRVRDQLFWTSVLVIFAFAAPGLGVAQVGWPTYGGDAGGQRYSLSKHITPANVAQLKVAWTYHTHALDNVRIGGEAASFEATPVLRDRTLYFADPFDVMIAIDATAGTERWRHDPHIRMIAEASLTTSRGVATWDSKDAGPCASRVFEGTLDARLLAVDAETGLACRDFGNEGEVDLAQGVALKPGMLYQVTSAPTVIGDVVVVGSSIPDNYMVNVPKGTVRGFDVRTGTLVWSWDPIGAWANKQEVRTGGGNSWSTIAADAKLGLIFVPTGSASPDYWGGTRPGDNRDADSVVALDGKTGRRVWGFQVVHHNVWDYDVAAEPLLFLWHGTVPAVAIGTKMGQIFVLDRRTGKPLFPVEERSVPQTDVEGEQTWPTQPFSSVEAINPTDMRGAGEEFARTPDNAKYCSDQMAGLRYEGMYTPPSLRGSLEYPGPIGGVNWGSMAFDPTTQTLYANNNSDVYSVKLIPRKAMDERKLPILLRPSVVLLVEPLGHYKKILLMVLVVLLLGMLVRRSLLPGWEHGTVVVLLLAAVPVHALLEFEEKKVSQDLAKRAMLASRGEDYSPMIGTPYWMYRHPIIDHDGRPCAKMPWGALTAVDLNTGKRVFRVAHGTEDPGQKTGSLNVSGPIVTAGGIVFTAGTREPLLHAYDSRTGAEVWQAKLPVPAQATPMTYEINGKQYVVVADGGHGIFGTKQGDSVIAFTLP